MCVCVWQEKQSEGACLMLLGNKTDLASADRREVTGAQGHRLAEVRNDPAHHFPLIHLTESMCVRGVLMLFVLTAVPG